MKRTRKTITGIATGAVAILLLCVFAAMPVCSLGVHASPGALAYGTAPWRTDSALQVSALQISIKVPEAFEESLNSELDIWENYATVTSCYTVHNPTKASVTERMAIPFGALPNYDYDSDDSAPILPHQDAYRITFKGQTVTPEVRHAFSRHAQRNDDLFKPMRGSAWDQVFAIQDTKIHDNGYYPTQKVTVHTYKVSNPWGITSEVGSEFRLVSTNLADMIDTAHTRVLVDGGGTSYGELSSYAEKDGSTFRVYVIGQDIAEIAWEAEPYGNEPVIKSIAVSLEGKHEITFEELAMQYYTPACGATETDWYNAVYHQFIECYAGAGTVDLFQPGSTDIRDYLQGWLFYEITLAPGESAELVTVTPAFPDQMNWYEPTVYEYGYDLVGLGRFSLVENVEITVDSSYHTVENSSYYHCYNVPAGTHSLTLDKIDRDTLLFSLCEKAEMSNTLETLVYGGLGLALLVGVALIVLLGVAAGVVVNAVIVAVTLIMIAIGKRKRKTAPPTDDKSA